MFCLRREVVFILTLQYKPVVQESLCRFKEEGVLFKEGGGVYTHSPV